MRIQVTADDIARGRQRSCFECPVARALRRTLADEGIWTVMGVPDLTCGVTGAQYRGVEGAKGFTFPEWVANRIASYDDSGDMEPFTFEVEEEAA